MSIFGTADSRQLAALTSILDDHCRNLGISNNDIQRETLGKWMMMLFNNGISDTNEIKRALKLVKGPRSESLVLAERSSAIQPVIGV